MRCCFLLWMFALSPLPAADSYVQVQYPPSSEKGELSFGVTYTLWLPQGIKTVRGIFVHQHGCGSGACKGGETAAYDLHWQALAKKWDCALLGPSYQQEDGQNCRLWCDPRNGSGKRFLQALNDLAKKANHPEIATAPWCLWGHSGGGYWASLMQVQHPERIVAIWFRSGTAYASWQKGEVPTPVIPATAYNIPMMLNPGAKEKGDKRFNGAWTGSFEMFQAYRAKGGLIGFAPDPRTSHECGDSRYLAIPFFDVCLQQRLPEKVGDPLRAMNAATTYLAEPLTNQIAPAKEYPKNPLEAVWLPNEAFAKAWLEYAEKGAVSDTTVPPAPKDFQAKATAEGMELTWQAEADLESGLQSFVIELNGKEISRYPEKPIGRYGRPLFQTMSYHDTPEKNYPEMKLLVKSLKVNPSNLSIRSVNSVGLKSEPTKATAKP